MPVPLSTISGGIGNVVTNVGRCSLDSNVAPGRILSGEPQNGIHDDLTDSRSSDNLSRINMHSPDGFSGSTRRHACRAGGSLCLSHCLEPRMEFTT